MPVAVLTLLKLVFLLLVYLFLIRVLRVIAADLYGVGTGRITGGRSSAPSRPVVAQAAAPPKGRKVPRQLVVHVEDAQPIVVPLTGQTVTIGRADHVTVALEDAYVSDEHAEIVGSDEGWMVRDLGSTNGTYLNGAKVIQLTQVAAGDQVRVGRTTVEVRR